LIHGHSPANGNSLRQIIKEHICRFNQLIAPAWLWFVSSWRWLVSACCSQNSIITAGLDYPGLLALSRAIEPSLVLFRGADWAETTVIERMGDILRNLAPEEIEQSILVVDPDRIRRRRLPI
jgi:hypothetical protein